MLMRAVRSGPTWETGVLGSTRFWQTPCPVSPTGTEPCLSTYWIDVALKVVSGGTEDDERWVVGGNETELVVTGETVQARSLYELFEPEEMPTDEFVMALQQYQEAVLAAIAAGNESGSTGTPPSATRSADRSRLRRGRPAPSLPRVDCGVRAWRAVVAGWGGWTRCGAARSAPPAYWEHGQQLIELTERPGEVGLVCLSRHLQTRSNVRLRPLPSTPPTAPQLVIVVPLCILAGCSGSSSSATSSHAPLVSLRTAAPTVGQPIRATQASLVGHVRGLSGGYTSLIVVTDAERSLNPSQTGTLITLAGIGRLSVTCSQAPTASFRLTSFAAGEGPPTVIRDSLDTHGLASLRSLTRGGQLFVPARERTHQTLQHWAIDGGGEAFQFTVQITDLLTPTAHRCDLAANATTVTHGPFYHYAHARPGSG